MSGAIQEPVRYFNPKKIKCMVCHVPDCEHFDIPVRVHSSSLWYRMIAMGWQPFIYTPFLPLYVTGEKDV
jgi:hypothetical protein